jgi:hypothetical protein
MIYLRIWAVAGPAGILKILMHVRPRGVHWPAGRTPFGLRQLERKKPLGGREKLLRGQRERRVA